MLFTLITSVNSSTLFRDRQYIMPDFPEFFFINFIISLSILSVLGLTS